MIRAVRYNDLEAIRGLFVAAFREEYGRRGVDIGAQVTRWRTLYPLIRLLSWFPNPYRYMLNVHVWEEDGRIAGFIQTSPGNRGKTRWHIDFVAVDPARQGQGIGAKLVEAVFGLYGALGVKCFTLEVDVQNAPALRLYEKLGFRQYAAMTYYQASPVTEELPAPTDAGTIGMREFRSTDAQALYELYLASTPAPVRLVDTRKPSDFATGLLERAMAGLRRRLGQVAEERWVFVDRERRTDGPDAAPKVVAYLRIVAQWRDMPHTVQIMVHPGYEHLYPVVLELASRRLASFPPRLVLAWAPDYQLAKQQALEDWGMKVITVDRCLVRDNLIALKLPAKESMQLTEDKVFKPAFTQKS